MTKFSTRTKFQFKSFYPLITILPLLLIVLECSHSNNIRNRLGQDRNVREDYRKDRSDVSNRETYIGYASYYADEFHGRLTANGEVFDMNAFTAAHRTLPFGTICRVTNLENDKSVEVRINDRGPFVDNRILDLSRAAAKAIGALVSGVVQIRLEVLSKPEEH
jgi:rare lipoprotein A (peptidoglycan hydrolase)